MEQASRYELKYVVEESRALAIRDFVRGYLEPSVYNQGGPLPGEPVITLYLDSPDLLFYRQAATGQKNRVKLRIRFYDGEWTHPAFLEIKRRVNDAILKRRAMVSREAVRQMLCGMWPSQSFWPEGSHLLDGKQQRDVQQDFFVLCNQVRARAVLYVSYMREAWESPADGLLRVTFDRHVRGTLYNGAGAPAMPVCGVRARLPYFPPDGVVLELKFTGASPRWLSEMVHMFNLQRRSVSKYCACVETIGLDRGLHASGSQWEAILL
ncbi:MAG: VTC domain-containing protein [Thermoguttaceae bacterium]